MDELKGLYRRALVERLCLEATDEGDHAWEVVDRGLAALVLADPDDLSFVRVVAPFRIHGLSEPAALRIANRAANTLKTLKMGWRDDRLVLSADRTCFPLHTAPSVEELAATVRLLLECLHAGARLLHDEMTLLRLDPDRDDDERVVPGDAGSSADS